MKIALKAWENMSLKEGTVEVLTGQVCISHPAVNGDLHLGKGAHVNPVTMLEGWGILTAIQDSVISVTQTEEETKCRKKEKTCSHPAEEANALTAHQRNGLNTGRIDSSKARPKTHPLHTPHKSGEHWSI